MQVASSSDAKAHISKKRRLQVTDRPHLPKPKTGPKQAVAGKSSSTATVPPEAVSPEKVRGIQSAAFVKEVAEEAHVDSSLPRTFKIIAGSYEKLLYGLEAAFVQEDELNSTAWKLKLQPIFIFPAHVSCIKAIAASPSGGKWLATGSTDEIIKVWDLRRRKEIGGLIHHQGSITYLTFPSRSHLLSASEDGTLCLFHARDWAVLRTLKGHKGRVNCVGIHPSGKLALSVGKDRTLRMWDLMRGKGSASTKLGKEGEVVRWSPSGSRFAVQSGSSIDIFATNMSVLHTITHPSRVHDVKFFRPMNFEGQAEFLLVAAEDKKVTIYEIPHDTDPSPKAIAELAGHTNRVKAIDTITVAIPPYSELKSAIYASTVSSDGQICVFEIGDVLRLAAGTTEHPISVEPIAKYDTKGSRLTCIAMGDGEMTVESQRVEKRKRVEGRVESDEVDHQPSEPEHSEDASSASDADQNDSSAQD